jgi:cytochrome c oxidase cbb3-type subunit 2
MPAYPWLAKTELEVRYLGEDLAVQQTLGVPYTDEMVENAARDAVIQGTQDAIEADVLLARYPNANIRDFTGGQATGRVTEADALIAYLQSLGTAIDYSLYDDTANIR